MDAIKHFKRHRKKVYISLVIITLYLWAPFIISAVFPKKYCINEHCFNRPSTYLFSYFLDGGKKVQSALCFYTFNCQNNFQGKDPINVIVFNNLFDETLALSISNTKDKKYIEYMKKNIDSSFMKCQYRKEIDENQYIYNGYFSDDNRSFTIILADENIANNIFKELCH